LIVPDVTVSVTGTCSPELDAPGAVTVTVPW
jgi:hypothetical protein